MPGTDSRKHIGYHRFNFREMGRARNIRNFQLHTHSWLQEWAILWHCPLSLGSQLSSAIVTIWENLNPLTLHVCHRRRREHFEGGKRWRTSTKQGWQTMNIVPQQQRPWANNLPTATLAWTLPSGQGHCSSSYSNKITCRLCELQNWCRCKLLSETSVCIDLCRSFHCTMIPEVLCEADFLAVLARLRIRSFFRPRWTWGRRSPSISRCGCISEFRWVQLSSVSFFVAFFVIASSFRVCSPSSFLGKSSAAGKRLAVRCTTSESV